MATRRRLSGASKQQPKEGLRSVRNGKCSNRRCESPSGSFDHDLVRDAIDASSDDAAAFDWPRDE